MDLGPPKLVWILLIIFTTHCFVAVQSLSVEELENLCGNEPDNQEVQTICEELGVGEAHLEKRKNEFLRFSGKRNVDAPDKRKNEFLRFSGRRKRKNEFLRFSGKRSDESVEGMPEKRKNEFLRFSGKRSNDMDKRKNEFLRFSGKRSMNKRKNEFLRFSG